MKAFDLMSVSLSQGLDNPELYVYIFNQFLTHNGYPEINVPKEAFIKKHTNSASQPTATNAHPSTPTIQTPIQPTHVSQPSSGLTVSSQDTPVIPSPFLNFPTTQTPPPAPVSDVPTLATQSPNLPTTISAVINDLIQAYSSPLATPPLTSTTPVLPHVPLPTESYQSLQMHAPSLSADHTASQLTFTSSMITSPPTILNPSNPLYLNLNAISPIDSVISPHGLIPPLTSPILTTPTSSHNPLNISILSPINLIHRLFAHDALSSCKILNYKTPINSRRRSANRRKKSVSTSYKLRTQRRLNYFES